MEKKHQTKSLVLKRGLDYASQHGYESLSFGWLAKDLGMSKSGLFGHFGSKEQLQIGVFDLGASQFVDFVMQPAIRKPRGLPRIRALADNWVRWNSDICGGGCPIITATVEVESKPGILRDHVYKLQREWIKGLEYAGQLAVSVGDFHPSSNPKQFAFELYSYMLGFHLYRKTMKDPGAEGIYRNGWELLLARFRDGTHVGDVHVT